jgi:hypothetical protein
MSGNETLDQFTEIRKWLDAAELGASCRKPDYADAMVPLGDYH